MRAQLPGRGQAHVPGHAHPVTKVRQRPHDRVRVPLPASPHDGGRLRHGPRRRPLAPEHGRAHGPQRAVDRRSYELVRLCSGVREGRHYPWDAGFSRPPGGEAHDGRAVCRKPLDRLPASRGVVAAPVPVGLHATVVRLQGQVPGSSRPVQPPLTIDGRGEGRAALLRDAPAELRGQVPAMRIVVRLGHLVARQGLHRVEPRVERGIRCAPPHFEALEVQQARGHPLQERSIHKVDDGGAPPHEEAAAVPRQLPLHFVKCLHKRLLCHSPVVAPREPVHPRGEEAALHTEEAAGVVRF
mmetsp:Transcript_38080/g.74606  ORF Transcript_38080/g.74606 Transcript_38080/m.74606 type:complete len:298 (-) Transcript_38080:778-1671(-)